MQMIEPSLGFNQGQARQLRWQDKQTKAGSEVYMGQTGNQTKPKSATETNAFPILRLLIAEDQLHMCFHAVSF